MSVYKRYLTKKVISE